jgi:hypothetical protein
LPAGWRAGRSVDTALGGADTSVVPPDGYVAGSVSAHAKKWIPKVKRIEIAYPVRASQRGPVPVRWRIVDVAVVDTPRELHRDAESR